VDDIFTKLNSSVEFNEPANTQIEYSAMEGLEEQNLSRAEPSQPKSLKEGCNCRQLPEQGAVGASAEIRSTSNKVIAMFGAANGISQVVVMEPRSFAEMPQAIQALRERKVVVLNMTTFDPEQAQRAIDFVAGATYAIDGRPQLISERTFLFTPSCVHVSTQSGAVHEVLSS
jgi:cell division inhibitor SepF